MTPVRLATAACDHGVPLRSDCAKCLLGAVKHRIMREHRYGDYAAELLFLAGVLAVLKLFLLYLRAYR